MISFFFPPQILRTLNWRLPVWLEITLIGTKWQHVPLRTKDAHKISSVTLPLPSACWLFRWWKCSYAQDQAQATETWWEILTTGSNLGNFRTETLVLSPNSTMQLLVKYVLIKLGNRHPSVISTNPHSYTNTKSYRPWTIKHWCWLNLNATLHASTGGQWFCL